jgi:hypothetical protein
VKILSVLFTAGPQSREGAWHKSRQSITLEGISGKKCFTNNFTLSRPGNCKITKFKGGIVER